jgi:hypothetical protein
MMNSTRNTLALSVTLLLSVVSVVGLAAETEAPPPLADVVSVAIQGEPGALEFKVGVRSLDKGCEQYADWWEILDTDGRLLYRRVLRHSHVDEQPFLRSGGPVDIAPDRIVWVRAHMHPTGYGGQAMKGSIGAGFTVAELDAGFAAELADRPPLPDDCAF